MGIARRRRAPLTVGDRPFTWYVTEGENGRSWGPILIVGSDDRRFSVLYPVGQADPPYVIVMGREFPGLPEAGAQWVRVRCPRFGDEAPITPAFVRRLVEWGLDAEKSMVRVDDRGQPLG